MVAKGSAILAAAAGTLVAGSAMALTDGPHSSTHSIVSELTNFDTNSGLAFPKFNPSLGTLTKVTLTISGDMTSTLTVTAGATGALNCYATSTMRLWVQDPGNHLYGGALTLAVPSYVSTPPDNPSLLSAGVSTLDSPVDLAANASYTWAPYSSGTVNKTYEYTTGPVLTEFTGTGDLFLRAVARASTTVGWDGGNATASQSTTGNVHGTVTYVYNAVPEAGTMLLGGCALMPILGYRRRSRKA
jgi:hypothetical protein